MDEFDMEPVKKNWWYIISPCAIAAVFAILVIILGLSEGGYGIFAIMLGIPFFLIMAGADFTIKYLFRHKKSNIWLVELGLIAVTILCFRFYFHEMFD